MKNIKNIWEGVKNGAKKGLVTLLVPGVIGISGCSIGDRYPQESVENGKIKVDLLNEIPHKENHFLRQYLGALGYVNWEGGNIIEELDYSFRKNDILQGKYTDKLTLGKTITSSTGYESFKQDVRVTFIDIGQDGIVDFTVMEAIPYGAWENGIQPIRDTTDLKSDFNQSGVSRLYQNLVGRID